MVDVLNGKVWGLHDQIFFPMPSLKVSSDAVMFQVDDGLTVLQMPHLQCRFKCKIDEFSPQQQRLLHFQWWDCPTAGQGGILCIWKDDSELSYSVDLYDQHTGSLHSSWYIHTQSIMSSQARYQVTSATGSFFAEAAKAQRYLAMSSGVKARCDGQDKSFYADLLTVLDVSCGEVFLVGTGLFRDNLETLIEWSPSGQHLAISEIWYGDARAFHIWDASLRAMTYSVDTNDGYRQYACWTPCSSFCVDPLNMQLLSMKDLQRQRLKSGSPQTVPPRQMVTGMDDHARTDPLRIQPQGCEPSMSPAGGLLLELRQNDAWQAYVQQFRVVVRGDQGWILPDKVPELQLQASRCVPIIAWCPCPAALYVYAVADDACRVHLVDGRSSKVIRTWEWEAPASLGLESASLATDMQMLQWSPDGLKLAFWGASGSSVIAFDVAEG